MMLPTKDQPTKIPAWIKLLKLPLEFWTPESFSKIASTIGKPLNVDNATAKRLRLDYARMCVEIDAGTELPYDVRIIVNGELVVVAIQYQWVPPICCDCKVFGHPQGSCSKQVSSKPPKDVWQVVGKGKIQANTGPEIQVVDESIPSSSF